MNMYTFICSEFMYGCMHILYMQMYLRGVRRNVGKGFPLHQSDCYIRVVYIPDCSIRVSRSFHQNLIQNNAISVAIM